MVRVFAFAAMEGRCGWRMTGRGEVRAALKPAKALLKLSDLAGSSCGILYGAGQKQIQRRAIHQVFNSPDELFKVTRLF